MPVLRQISLRLVTNLLTRRGRRNARPAAQIIKACWQIRESYMLVIHFLQVLPMVEERYWLKLLGPLNLMMATRFVCVDVNIFSVLPESYLFAELVIWLFQVMLGIDCFGKTIYFMWPESEGKEFKTSPEVTINFTDPHSLLKQLSLSTFSIEGEIDDSSSWFIKHYLKWCISRFFLVAFPCYSV